MIIFTVLSDLSVIHNTEVLEDYFTVEVPLITNDLFLSIHGKNESHMSPRGFQFPTSRFFFTLKFLWRVLMFFRLI